MAVIGRNKNDAEDDEVMEGEDETIMSADAVLGVMMDVEDDDERNKGRAMESSEEEGRSMHFVSPPSSCNASSTLHSTSRSEVSVTDPNSIAIADVFVNGKEEMSVIDHSQGAAAPKPRLHFYDSDSTDGSIVFNYRANPNVNMNMNMNNAGANYLRANSSPTLQIKDDVSSNNNNNSHGMVQEYTYTNKRPPNTPTRVLPYHQRRLLANKSKQTSAVENSLSQTQTLNQSQTHMSSAAGYRSKRPAKLNTIGGTTASNNINIHDKPSAPLPEQYRPVDRRASDSNNTSINNASTKPHHHHHQQHLPPTGRASPSEQHQTLNHNQTNNNTSNKLRSNMDDSIDSKTASNRKPHPWGTSANGSFHIRADSTGSVSSLGSSIGTGGMRSLTERLGKDIAGFLQNQTTNVFNLSPNNSASNIPPLRERTGSIEDETKHFHNRNQAFLHKQELEKAKRHNTLRDLSPVRRAPIRSNSPRPPNTRGAHRPGLASIEDDNWEEEDHPPSHKGRTFKHQNNNNHHNQKRNNSQSPPTAASNAAVGKPPSHPPSLHHQHAQHHAHQQTSHEPPASSHDYYNNRHVQRHHHHHHRTDNRHDEDNDGHEQQQQQQQEDELHNHDSDDNRQNSLDTSDYSNEEDEEEEEEEEDESDEQHTSSAYNSFASDPPTTEEHDDDEEDDDEEEEEEEQDNQEKHERNPNILMKKDNHNDEEEDEEEEEPHERTSLLPPSGISTHEHGGYGGDTSIFDTQRISNTTAANLASTVGGGGSGGVGGGGPGGSGSRSKHGSSRDHHHRHLHPTSSHHRDYQYRQQTNNSSNISPAGDREDFNRKDKKKSKRRDRQHERDRKNREMERKWEEKRRKFKKSKKHKKSSRKYYSSHHHHHGHHDRSGKHYHHHHHDSRHHHHHHGRGRQRHRDIYYRDYSSSSQSTSDSSSSSSDSGSSSSSYDYKRWAKKKALKLEKERAKLIAQWKEEARLEAEAIRKEEEARRWYNRFKRWTGAQCAAMVEKSKKFLSKLETFICNLPLTIGAVALAIVTLGVVWFKFAEENIDSCEPVHFHSPQCTFPEFPGCFYCDTDSKMYKLAVNFHYACSTLSGILAISFFAKILLARRVVIDEMSSPTTSSPAGLICMTMVCVFAGRGWVGQLLVSLAATMHLGLVIWFIYMALAYHILPEPSWYPNTVGVGLSAVKTWLYYPLPGHFLMAISLSLNFFFFPISLIRVALNNKISAPVCWIQMSAPSISLYALTIMAQPSFQEEHPDVTKFQRVHRMVYLPCMHFLFILCLTGFFSSVQSLWTRWDNFKKKEFSPAHAAFCFPTLAHANAVQAYRGAIDAFSDIRPGSPFKILIYTYWVVILVGGTIATFIITAKFFYCLPSWTQVNVDDEVEPPAPSETVMADVITTGETLRQNFVSPAVLQANETGVLVRDGHGRYVRTRKLTAIGFEPMMTWSEMNEEREALLDWVEKNPARQRKRTLSVPGIDFINYGIGEFGTNNQGVFDVENTPGGRMGRFRGRAQTSEGHSRQVKSSVFY